MLTAFFGSLTAYTAGAQPRIALTINGDSVQLTNQYSSPIAPASIEFQLRDTTYTTTCKTWLPPGESLRFSTGEVGVFLSSAEFPTGALPDTATVLSLLSDSTTLGEFWANAGNGTMRLIDMLIVHHDTLLRAPTGPIRRQMQEAGWTVRDGLVLAKENNRNYVRPPSVIVSKSGALKLKNNDVRFWSSCRLYIYREDDEMFVRSGSDDLGYIKGGGEETVQLKQWARMKGRGIEHYSPRWNLGKIVVDFEVSDGRRFMATLRESKKGRFDKVEHMTDMSDWEED